LFADLAAVHHEAAVVSIGLALEATHTPRAAPTRAQNVATHALCQSRRDMTRAANRSLLIGRNRVRLTIAVRVVIRARTRETVTIK
jgi:hypothetical protein